MIEVQSLELTYKSDVKDLTLLSLTTDPVVNNGLDGYYKVKVFFLPSQKVNIDSVLLSDFETLVILRMRSKSD